MPAFEGALKPSLEAATSRQMAEVPGPYDFNYTDPTSHDPAISGSKGWIERIGDESPANYETSPRYAHATLYTYVLNDRDSYYAFENAVLGWHVVNDDLKYIKRTNPIQHPRKRNLFASKISEAHGVQFTGRSILSQNIIDVSPKSYAKYNYMLVAVDFMPARYDMPQLSEIEGTNPETGASLYYENYRYVEQNSKTNIYDVSIQTGQFAYAEGAPKGEVFQGELNYLETKTTFNLKWHLVPRDFVFDTYHYGVAFPTKIAKASGKVNSRAFMGFQPGTLLLLEPEWDFYPSGSLQLKQTPLFAWKPGANLIDRPFWMCDINFPMIHFDPTLGDGKTLAEGSAGFHGGHNAKPRRESTDTQLRYYLVKYATGTPPNLTYSEIKIYGEYDFNKIFQHWSIA